MDCLCIAHGAKGPMNSSLVSYFHSGLAARDFLTVKFNFPYTEGRWRLARKPDRTEVLVEYYRRVVEDTRKSEWKPRVSSSAAFPCVRQLRHMWWLMALIFLESKDSSFLVIRSTVP